MATDSNYFYRNYGKRWLDLALSISALVVSAPVMGLVAGLSYFNLGRPILFRQLRPGLNNQTFKVLKFRSMSNTCDATGTLLPDSQRLTPFGHFLRKTSLDELPQLWNVIKGDMSLVGPRPLLAEYLPYYTERESKRHSVRPGITGLAQINGRNCVPWNERLELDVYYVENCSLSLDLLILYNTIVKTLCGSDIDAANIYETNLRLERLGQVETQGEVISDQVSV
jgi:lipopolysaccharide/colanic/teichoic acid biosynthesis glycosyltransferase